MNKGWIRLYRKTLDNPSLKGRMLSLWVGLLLLATHQKQEAIFDGAKILLQPGQFITGRKYLARLSGYSESGVEGALACLEKEHQIQQQKSNKNRLITVNNWELYQQKQQEKQQQTDNKKTRTRMEEGKEDVYTDEYERFSTMYQKESSKKVHYTEQRLAHFRARRKLFSFEEMVEATKKMLADDFMCGVNPNKKFYATIDYILRNDENVEKYLDPNPTRVDPTERKAGESLGEYLKRTI